MGALDTLQDGITTGIGAITNFIGEHPVGTALGAAGVVATGAGIVALTGSTPKTKTKKKTRKKHKKITHTKRGWKQDRARRSKQKWEVAYQRRKRKHKGRKLKFGSKAYRKRYLHPHHKRKNINYRRTGKVKYTRKGQPYIILKSGKSRFIKKTKRRNK